MNVNIDPFLVDSVKIGPFGKECCSAFAVWSSFFLIDYPPISHM